MSAIVIAIDGPAGSGKSTVAAAAAVALGVPHVDTGAYYRAATLACLRAGVDLGDPSACAGVVAAHEIARPAGRTLLDGEDVEDEIRGAEVTAAVSTVSRHPAVRAALRQLQRGAVGTAGAVVEGRDAGTAVVPDATLKVWLTADPVVRARRRAAQLGAPGEGAVAEQAVELAARDARDAAQMRQAPDVIEVDTTGRDVGSLVEEIVARARAAVSRRTS